MPMLDAKKVYLNGIDGQTGKYLVEPLTTEEVANCMRGERSDPLLAKLFKRLRDLLKTPILGAHYEFDVREIGKEAGWAIVFAKSAAPELRQALEPLIEHRRLQISPDRFKVLDYQDGETFRDWLNRHGVHPGSVEPRRVPYYVLLIGDPQDIPFEFQYILGLEYAVGRLAFDTTEQYRQYVDSVIEYETGPAPMTARQIVYWGVQHAGDPATEMSCNDLIAPLFRGRSSDSDGVDEEAIATELSFASLSFQGQEATKENLLSVLNDTCDTPAVLFTASHGMGWRLGDLEHHEQRYRQGALLCQDWPGFGSIAPEHYLKADEISENAQFKGVVAFLFACFSAGTPAYDNFLKEPDQRPVQIAEHPFVAALPQRLLSHPRGAALGVFGHVERAWGFSIRPPKVGRQIQPFRNLIGRILVGEPLGNAPRDFRDKYAALSADMLEMLLQGKMQHGPLADDYDLACTAIERNDARNYILLGDPAARVRVS